MLNIYDILCHHYLVYDQNGNHIKSSHQLVNFFCNNLNLHPWFETNHTPGLFRLYNRISILILRILLGSQKSPQIIFSGIKPWFSVFVQELQIKRLPYCNLLYIHRSNILQDSLRFCLQIVSLFTRQKVIYLWRESDNNIFNKVLSFIQKSSYRRYISSNEILGLASLVSSTLFVTHFIPRGQHSSLTSKKFYLAEGFSPLSISILFKNRDLSSVYSHGSISSFTSSFTNDHLFNTLTGYPICNHFNAQTKAAINFALTNQLNYQKVSPIAIKELPSKPKVRFSTDKLVFLYASTYKPLNNLRFGLFPFSTQYLTDLLFLSLSLARYPNTELLISHRDMGELSIDDIQKAFHHFDVPSQNISISNKSFEVNAAQSSVLVSHTSTTIEQWLPTNKPIILFKINGVSNPFLDTSEISDSDLYIVDEDTNSLSSILDIITNPSVQI